MHRFTRFNAADASVISFFRPCVRIIEAYASSERSARNSGAFDANAARYPFVFTEFPPSMKSSAVFFARGAGASADGGGGGVDAAAIAARVGMAR
jgi:hypothetical protein